MNFVGTFDTSALCGVTRILEHDAELNYSPLTKERKFSRTKLEVHGQVRENEDRSHVPSARNRSGRF